MISFRVFFKTRTQVPYNFFDHVLQHSSAVLRVKERQELLLIQHLVRGRTVGLKPAVLQTLQNLLSWSDDGTQKWMLNLLKTFFQEFI